MRNPNRLDSFYETLKEVHKDSFPDWRFGQLMSNFLGWCVSSGKCGDIWFPEEDKWEEWIREYGEQTKNGIN